MAILNGADRADVLRDAARRSGDDVLTLYGTTVANLEGADFVL